MSLNAWDNISLHDCELLKIDIDGDNICCKFKHGFWITPNNPYSQSNKIIKSDDNSYIIIYGMQDIIATWEETCNNSEKTAFQNEHADTDLAQLLLHNINTGKWSFEIIYQETDNDFMVVGGYIHFNKAPFDTFIIVRFKYSRLEYYWNSFNFHEIF